MSTHGGQTGISTGPATTVVGPDAYGAPAVVGVSTKYARGDHDHGLPGLVNPALQYNDLLGWSYPPELLNASLVLPAAATIYLTRIPLSTPLTITNILIRNGIAGLTLTHSFVALFTSAGTFVGQSVDQSTNWASGVGLQTLPLAGGPYNVTPLAANDFIWTGAYVGTAVTRPAFTVESSSGLIINVGTTTARSRWGYIAQANTATLASFSPAALTPDNSDTIIWMAIS